MCKRLLCALFSNLIDFDSPSSKCHISSYNHHWKLKLVFIDLCCNTRYHANRTFYLTKPSFRYSSLKRLHFLRHPVIIYQLMHISIISDCTTGEFWEAQSQVFYSNLFLFLFWNFRNGIKILKKMNWKKSLEVYFNKI